MSLALRTSHAAPRRGRSLIGLYKAAAGALTRLKRTAALRREIDRMDDHMLSDIGVSRAQLEFEVDYRR